MPNGNESPSPGASGLPAPPVDWNGRIPANIPLRHVLERPERKRGYYALYFDYETVPPNVIINFYDGHDGPKVAEAIIESAKGPHRLCWLEPKPHPDTPQDRPCEPTESPAESPT